MNHLHLSRGARTALALAAALCLAAPGRAADKLEYNRDVRPILAENCFACHGPDKAARKAKLRLDVREDAIKKGAIVPGKPDQSALVERVFSHTKRFLMPPARTKKTLSAREKNVLRAWVAAGAEYQPHWSLIAPKRPPLPRVKDSAWCRNPIDSFILAALEKRGLRPAPEADRLTLARRASLDLTGLPPTPAQVDSFLNDKRSDAYERYVDRLLESPAWGEHRGRYWLDAARYADTHGIHFDNFREMWAYRDWVIKAFNANMPFDRFTIEQLAGDLLPKPTVDQKIATGFNRCNITTNEGGAIDEEYLVLYTRDRTETASHVWLGLTANCAVCHDHKFDPISQREFYSMAAFFNNTTQRAMDGNIKDTPPVLFVPRPADRPRWDNLQKQLADVRKGLDARKHSARVAFDEWLSSLKPGALASTVPAEGLRLHAPLSEGTGAELNLNVDGKPRKAALKGGFAWDSGHVADKAFKSKPGPALELPDVGDFERDQGFSYGAWVKIPTNKVFGAVVSRMNEDDSFRGWDLWVENGRVGTHIIHKWPDNALKVVTQTPLKAGKWTHVFVTYDGSAKASGVKLYLDGVLQTNRQVQADKLRDTIRTTVPLKLAQRSKASRVLDVGIQDLRIYGKTLPEQDVQRIARGTRVAYLAGKPAGKRSPAEVNELFDWWLPANDKPYQDLARKADALRKDESAVRARGTVAHVSFEKTTPPMAHVLYRGEYDKRRAPVKPGTPKALPPMPPELPRNRLGFARWLLRPEHPLTARVTVNRFWQQVFGTGIVATSGDFGVMGEAPTHPELLDWLAVEFREGNWDVKKFFKLLVTSSAYRQAALTTPQKREKDPQNRLLSRGARFRMDAEMIRDHALASSGLLVRKLGGPSVKPYQPEGVWEAVAMIGSNTRDYKRDSGAKLYRRSLYTFWKRAAPPASMEIFNAPSREFCTVRRERTNTPLQALVTLNDPQFVEAARSLAERTLLAPGDKPDERIDFMARRLLARPMRAEEKKVVREILDDLLAHYRADRAEAKKLIAVGESKPDPALDPAALAAWTMVANQLMNLDEVLNK